MTCIYTAIYNNYDTLRPPPNDGHRRICITDNPEGSAWESRVVPCSLSPRRCARRAKVLYHLLFPDEDITIWHGGNVRLRGDLTKLVALLDSADIAVIKHSQRDCIYDEAEVCKRWGLDAPDIIDAQMTRYRQDGYPAKRGLSCAFLIARRNTQAMRHLAVAWWNEIQKGSHRDQLSLDYCLWKAGIVPARIPGDIYAGPNYTRSGEHK
ncbi:DUF616 domain-containing protein [Candidatus Uhrbacteria bacterium]|nr:DUF616 domain-containing protein [Candidatus Uhrbacteria bacterium]